MATGALSLPGAPQGIASDPGAQKEYLDALSNVMQSLEARANADNPWAVAAGFLKPTRTGSFGESLGNAAEQVGRRQEEQEKLAVPMAQMRAEMAGKKYEVGKKSRALEMAGAMLGLDPAGAEQAIAGGNMSPAAILQLDPRKITALKLYDKEMGDALEKTFDMTMKLRAAALEDRKANMTEGELVAKYGKDIYSVLPSSAPPAAGGNRPAPASGASAPVKFDPTLTYGTPSALLDNLHQVESGGGQNLLNSKTKALGPYQFMPETIVDFHKRGIQFNPMDEKQSRAAADWYLSDLYKRTGDWNKALAAYGGFSTQDPTDYISKVTKGVDMTKAGTPPASNTSDLPLASQAKIAEERTTAADKPWAEQRVAVNAWTPQATSNSNRSLKELYEIADKAPQVFGLMQNQGLLPAIAAAAQEGIQVGRMGSISLPVEEFIKKTKLNPNEQTIARRAAQLLADQFFENAKANKSILGPQISNADATFMQAPMATPQDSAAMVKYWVQNHVLINKQRDDIYKSLQGFDKQYGAKVSPGEFFNSQPYREILQTYDTLNEQLRKRSPLYQGQ